MAAGLDALREQTLRVLGRQYAAGNLSVGTLEHRVRDALAASMPDDLAAVTWDLPEATITRWRELKRRLALFASRTRCSRVSFKTAPEVVVLLDSGPRTLRIGRDATCEVVLHDPTVSRHHALLSVRGEVCTVRDLGSTNGVLVNGRPVVTSVLHAGDLLSFGHAVHATVR